VRYVNWSGRLDRVADSIVKHVIRKYVREIFIIVRNI
jgi:hypothetical protein